MWGVLLRFFLVKFSSFFSCILLEEGKLGRFTRQSCDGWAFTFLVAAVEAPSSLVCMDEVPLRRRDYKWKQLYDSECKFS